MIDDGKANGKYQRTYNLSSPFYIEILITVGTIFLIK